MCQSWSWDLKQSPLCGLVGCVPSLPGTSFPLGGWYSDMLLQIGRTCLLTLVCPCQCPEADDDPRLRQGALLHQSLFFLHEKADTGSTISRGSKDTVFTMPRLCLRASDFASAELSQTAMHQLALVVSEIHQTPGPTPYTKANETKV